MRGDTGSDPGVDLGSFSRSTGSVSVQALRNGSVTLPSLLPSFSLPPLSSLPSFLPSFFFFSCLSNHRLSLFILLSASLFPQDHFLSPWCHALTHTIFLIYKDQEQFEERSCNHSISQTGKLRLTEAKHLPNVPVQHPLLPCPMPWKGF